MCLIFEGCNVNSSSVPSYYWNMNTETDSATHSVIDDSKPLKETNSERNLETHRGACKYYISRFSQILDPSPPPEMLILHTQYKHFWSYPRPPTLPNMLI